MEAMERGHKALHFPVIHISAAYGSYSVGWQMPGEGKALPPVTLPNNCVLAADIPVTLDISSGFFAPNPVAGTTVVLSLATSADTEPLAASGYTIGMPVLPCFLCPHLSPIVTLPK